jgi:hypothetical protein
VQIVSHNCLDCSGSSRNVCIDFTDSLSNIRTRWLNSLWRVFLEEGTVALLVDSVWCFCQPGCFLTHLTPAVNHPGLFRLIASHNFLSFTVFVTVVVFGGRNSHSSRTSQSQNAVVIVLFCRWLNLNFCYSRWMRTVWSNDLIPHEVFSCWPFET